MHSRTLNNAKLTYLHHRFLNLAAHLNNIMVDLWRVTSYSMVMEGGGVTIFKLGSAYMHPVPMCCTRITNAFQF